jgi:hypothetical protein
MNYNAVIKVEDISDDSGVITEPVTLDEMKNYLRSEGFQDASGINTEPTIAITLAAGQTSVQDNRLIDAVIISLAREGTTYTQGLSVANRKFLFVSATGTLSFQDAAASGGETLDISYGYSNGNGVFNFTTDDDLLSDMITASRELIEEKYGISIIDKTLESIVTNLCGNEQLQRGPVKSVTSVTSKDGTGFTTDQIKVYGDHLECPQEKNMTVVYEVGYTVLPKPLKNEIMRLATYLYENRGDDAKLEAFKYQLAGKYARKPLMV